MVVLLIVNGGPTMTAINTTSDTITGASAVQDVWSVGDYDRLASYGSAPEAAHFVASPAVQPEPRRDVGTGWARSAILAAQHGARIAAGAPRLRYSRRPRKTRRSPEARDIDWREGAAEDLPFPDASFDIVLSRTRTCSARNPRRPLERCCGC